MTSRAERARRWVDGELGAVEEAALFAEAERDPALRAALDDAVLTLEALAALEPEGPPAPPPDLVNASVLRAVTRRAEEERAPLLTKLLRGRLVLRPRPIRLRPLGLALGVAALTLAALWARDGAAPGAPMGEGPAGDASAVAVRLILPAEGARHVAVAGDFNDWATDRTFLEDPEGDGVFTGMLRVPPGSYAYMFVIDGEEWVADPYAATYRDDGFGNQNAVLRVVD